MKTKLWIWTGSMGMALAAGCGLDDGLLPGSGSGTPGTAPVSVSLYVPPQSASFAAACADITSARLVIREIDLRGYTECGSPSPTPSATASSCEVEPGIGPFLVDLSGSEVDGTLQQGVMNANLPVAHYDRVRYELHKLEDGASSSDPALQAMIDARLSVRVDGLDENGAPFTFESDINDRREDSISLDVGNTVTGIDNITLVVDLSTWFGTAGACLDPVTDRDTIEERIEASIDLLEDDDGNGS